MRPLAKAVILLKQQAFTSFTINTIMLLASYSNMRYFSSMLSLLFVSNIGPVASMPALQAVADRANSFNVPAYSALGDSYASGPGAGSAVAIINPCKRFDQAFGPQINVDTDVMGSTKRQFSFTACSGSKTSQIYQDSTFHKSQAGQLAGKNPNLVTLSIGGNDVGTISVHRNDAPLTLAAVLTGKL